MMLHRKRDWALLSALAVCCVPLLTGCNRETTLVEYAEQGKLQITVTANGPDRVNFALTGAANCPPS